ncbi:hypothetical protein D3C71_1348890 [compost metagenome]
MFKHLFAQQLQTFRGDNPVFFAHRQQHFMRCFDAAGRTKRNVPALNAILPGEGFQLLHRCHFRALEVFSVYGAAREIHLRKADAAHTAAFNQLRLKVFANDQLGRTAADIDHQLAAFFRLSVFHAHENQSRFFVTRDYLNRIGDNFFRAFEKLRCVQRLAQRVRSDDAHAGRRKAL